MPKFAELGLTNEKVGDVDFASMPEQRGGFGPLPQPGTYRFKVPTFDASSPVFDTITTQKGARLNLKFEGAFALTIIQSSGNAHNGEAFEWRLSNQEFNRSRKGEPDIFVSDMDYILRDVLKQEKRPATNVAYGQAMIKAFSGAEFTADEEFTWFCNPKNDIRVDDGQGGTTVVEGTKGCESRYYQGGKNGVQKVHADENDPASPLVYPERITCNGKDGVPCGAVIRAFPRLRNFRA
jgi:hypothetical protein